MAMLDNVVNILLTNLLQPETLMLHDSTANILARQRDRVEECTQSLAVVQQTQKRVSSPEKHGDDTRRK